MEDNFITYKHYRTFNNTAIYVSECGGVMTLNPRRGRHYLKMRTKASPAAIRKNIFGKKYPQVQICFKDKTYDNYIHRIVAEVWLRPKNLFEIEVDHLDGNIMNFHVLNLEWVTHEENVRRSVEARRIKKLNNIKKGAKQ